MESSDMSSRLVSESDGDQDTIIIVDNSSGKLASSEKCPEALGDIPRGRTPQQKAVARAVVVVSSLLFLLSVLLIIVSLTMSDHIDELVREANRKYWASSQVSVVTEGLNSTRS